jgi:hypothetical protein
VPRRVKVLTREMGAVELYLIYSQEGVWEEEWRPLQASVGLLDGIGSLPKDEMEQAYIGWTKPLVEALGPPPKGKLIKLPAITRACMSRQRCPFYRPRDCGHLLKKMPWCFEPDGVEDPAVRQLLMEVIKLWREGVYVLVVLEPKP